MIGDEAIIVTSLLLSSPATSYECHCKLLIFFGKVENKISLSFFLEKLISIIPISAGSDLTTFPPTTSPSNWHPKQKPKYGFFKLTTNSLIFFFSSTNQGC